MAEGTADALDLLPCGMVPGIGIAPRLPRLPLGRIDGGGAEDREPFGGLLQYLEVGRFRCVAAMAACGAHGASPDCRQWSIAWAMYFLTMRSETPRCPAIST